MVAKPPSPLNMSQSSLPDLEDTPRSKCQDEHLWTPDSGYASNSTTPERTPVIEISKGTVIKRTTKLKVFEGEIPAHINNRFLDLQELFNRSLYETLTRNGKNFGDLTMKLKRLGTSEANSAYWVVIQCEPRIARRVRKFLDQDHVKTEYQPSRETGLPTLNVLVHPQPPLRLAKNSYSFEEAWAWIDPKGLALSGSLLKCSSGMAAIGGLVMTETQGTMSLNYLTSGHIIPTSDESDVLNTDDDVGRSSDDARSEDGPFEDFELDLGSSFNLRDEGPPSIRMRNIDGQKRIPAKILDVVQNAVSRCYDWALVALDEEALYRPNVFENGEKRLYLREAYRRSVWLPAPRPVSALAPKSGLLNGCLSGSPTFYLTGSASGFAQMYSLRLDDKAALQHGDSGSWVFDQKTGEVFGHVVASDIFGDVSVSPLRETLKQVEESLGVDRVWLPEPIEIHRWVERHGGQRDIPVSFGDVELYAHTDVSHDLDSAYASQNNSPAPLPPQGSLRHPSSPQEDFLTHTYKGGSRARPDEVRHNPVTSWPSLFDEDDSGPLKSPRETPQPRKGSKALGFAKRLVRLHRTSDPK